MKFRWWVVLATALFALGFFLGMNFPAGSADAGTVEMPFAEFADSQLEDMSGEFRPLLSFSTFGLFAFIFVRNVIAISFAFALSPFFCIMPVFSMLLNGFLIGMVSTMVVQEQSLEFLLAALLPHGIIEIPALLMAGATAIRFGWSVIRAVMSERGRAAPFSGFSLNAGYLRLALLLFLPAAIIEAFVTPLFIT